MAFVFEASNGLLYCDDCDHIIECNECGDMPETCPECGAELDYSYIE